MPVLTSRTSDDLNVTIRITGRFDFSCYRDFQSAYTTLPVPASVTVDLLDAEYMDSAALGMLLLLRDKLSTSKGNVRITNCRGQPKEVLQVANFGRLFKIE